MAQSVSGDDIFGSAWLSETTKLAGMSASGAFEARVDPTGTDPHRSLAELFVAQHHHDDPVEATSTTMQRVVCVAPVQKIRIPVRPTAEPLLLAEVTACGTHDCIRAELLHDPQGRICPVEREQPQGPASALQPWTSGMNALVLRMHSGLRDSESTATTAENEGDSESEPAAGDDFKFTEVPSEVDDTRVMRLKVPDNFYSELWNEEVIAGKRRKSLWERIQQHAFELRRPLSRWHQDNSVKVDRPRAPHKVRLILSATNGDPSRDHDPPCRGEVQVSIAIGPQLPQSTLAGFGFP